MTALIGAGCASTPQAAPAPTVVAATAPAVGEGDVRKVGDALSSVNSFRMHGQLKEDDGTSVDYSIEFVKPDRQHMTITTGGQTIESISIGSAQYMKIGPAWTKAGSGGSGTQSLLPWNNTQSLVDAFKEETSNGDSMVKGSLSAVDGAPCQEWTITSSDGDQTSTCVGLTDNLPRRFHTSEGDLIFSDFNAPLKIEAPI